MKNIATLLFSLLFSISAFAGEKVMRKGAVPGRWTHDYDAAAEIAKENGLPVLLKFTGSDWCGWCMLMEKAVFSKKEFEKWSEGRVLLVTIDSPRERSLVPEEYHDRNARMMNQYGIRGVPTYVVLDAEGKELGRLGASQTATPESFAKDFEKIVGTMPEKKRIAGAVSGEELEKLMAMHLSIAQRKAMETKLTPDEQAEFPTLLTIDRDKTAALDALAAARSAKIDEARAKIAEAQKTDPAAAARLRDESRAMLKALDEEQAAARRKIEEDFSRKLDRLRELKAKLN